MRFKKQIFAFVFIALFYVIAEKQFLEKHSALKGYHEDISDQ